VKVVGYTRVSTEEQGTNGAGLDAQRTAIRAECDRRSWDLVRIHEDVLSGRSMNRPGLQNALAACRGGEAIGLVVAKLDRLSRSIVDFGNLLMNRAGSLEEEAAVRVLLGQLESRDEEIAQRAAIVLLGYGRRQPPSGRAGPAVASSRPSAALAHVFERIGLQLPAALDRPRLPTS
jgi:predicted site-specific integrase-resolvase